MQELLDFATSKKGPLSAEQAAAQGLAGRQTGAPLHLLRLVAVRV